MNNKFFDLYVHPSDNPVFCYRSGLAVYEEKFLNGTLISVGRNAAGYPLNILECMPSHLNPNDFSEPSAFNIDIDGVCLDYSLEFIDYKTKKTESKADTTLIFESKIKPVRIKIHTVYDGSQMFTRYIEIENLSSSPLNLSRLSLISGGVEETDHNRFIIDKVNKIYSVGYFESDKWGREGEFEWHDLTPETLSVSTCFGADRFRHPFIIIRNNITGVIHFYQIGWSSGCRFTIDFQANKNRNYSNIAVKAEITSHNPKAIIAPYETFVTPAVHFGIVNGDFDDAINEMHSHTRNSVLNLPEADASQCLVGAGLGAEHSMTVDYCKKAIDQFAEMGGEVFILDAGWECPPDLQTSWGDYSGVCIPDSERYPNGIIELVDYCHSKGLKFGLWVDIESLGKKSSNYTNHPDWRATNLFGDKNPRMIDMSLPEVAQWAETELERIITEYKIDLLRVDHNVSYREYFAFNNNECISMRHHNAVYKMYNNLKKKFPDVIFENCAGGGGRTDLGMMKIFNHTWVSDCQRAPYSVSITNGMTMVLPPERVDRLFAGMGCHDQGSLDLHIRNTMLSHMSINIIAPENAVYNTVQMEFIKRSIELYKNFIRPILPVSKIFHHTPEAMKEGKCIIEISTTDCNKGVLGIFALNNNNAVKLTITPKGIDVSKRYKVMLDNSRSSFILNGFELYNGLSVTLPCSLSSELVTYEAI